MQIKCPKCNKDFDMYPLSYVNKKDMLMEEQIDMSKAATEKARKTLIESRGEAETEHRDKFDIPGGVVTKEICPNGCHLGPGDLDKQLKRRMKKSMSHIIMPFEDVRAQIGKEEYVFGTYIRRCSCRKSICNINYIRKYNGEVVVALDGDIQVVYPDRTKEEKEKIAQYETMMDHGQTALKKALQSTPAATFKLMIAKAVEGFMKRIKGSKDELAEKLQDAVGAYYVGTMIIGANDSIAINLSYVVSITATLMDTFGRDPTEQFIKYCENDDPEELKKFYRMIDVPIED
jgi:hypothetical protein